MLIFALALATQPPALSLSQAKALVLASPTVEASVHERGARPFFEWTKAAPRGWTFTVNARNPCQGQGPCSALLGHFSVDRYSGIVVDLDAGEDGLAVSSPDMVRLLERFRHRR